VRAIDRGAVVLCEPGVSWIDLPSQRYRGPEQRSRRLPGGSGRIQHSYGTTRRVRANFNTWSNRTSTKAEAPGSACQQFQRQPAFDQL